jgi:hypothetical protein
LIQFSLPKEIPMLRMRNRSVIVLALLLIVGFVNVVFAYSIAYTTVPNSSGTVTCSGLNPNYTTATWTVGGSIIYHTSAPPFPLTSPWENFHDEPSAGNPNLDGTPLAGNDWEIRLAPSANCSSTPVDFEVKLTYVVPGPTTTVDTLATGSGSISSPVTFQWGGGFSSKYGVKDVQYKTVSSQSSPTAAGPWTAATPYL